MFQLCGNDKESMTTICGADVDSLAALRGHVRPFPLSPFTPPEPDVIKANEDGHATEVQKHPPRPTAPDWVPRKFGWFLLFTVCLIAQQCVYV